MSFEFIRKLPTPEEIRRDYAVPERIVRLKEERDREIRDVFMGKSNKFLVIIGPCSADNEDAVCDYVSRLARVNEKVKDRLILIPRVYTNKPRTTGDGYKGLVHQPDPEKKPDFLQGLIAMRKMHIRTVEESGLTSADEMLYPENWRYVSDILSYVAIGARSVEDQLHRLAASGFDVPAGMKNPTSGDFSVMLNSVYAAQHPHSFIYRGWEVNTTGNDLAHTVLRGATNKHGRNIPNYHYEDLNLLLNLYGERELKNPACIIDANHSNSDKQHKQQIRIVKEVMHSRKLNHDIHTLVKGVMIESYIEEGCQKVGGGVYGKSITDPCLSWEDSERLIYDSAEYEYYPKKSLSENISGPDAAPVNCTRPFSCGPLSGRSFSDQPFQSPLILRPAVSVTGREKRMDFALLSMPAFSMMAFMISFFFSDLVTMKVISFSSASVTPRNFSAFSIPVPLACTTVPPPAPASLAASITRLLYP